MTNQLSSKRHGWIGPDLVVVAAATAAAGAKLIYHFNKVRPIKTTDRSTEMEIEIPHQRRDGWEGRRVERRSGKGRWGLLAIK